VRSYLAGTRRETGASLVPAIYVYSDLRGTVGMSLRLLKFSGDSVDDYAI
jgi:hypothetical protein